MTRARASRVGRVGLAGLLLLVLVAALPWLRGRDPARSLLRARFTARGDDPAAVESLRRELGIGDGVWSGSTQWLAGLLHGDLGTSWRSGAPVVDTVGPAMRVSLGLASGALVVAVLVAVVVLASPVWRAVSTGRPVSSRAGALGAVLAALPEVVVGSCLVLLVAVRLQWLPAIGWGTAADAALPTVALGIPSGGLLARLVTGTVDQALREPWVTTWRANGLPRRLLLATVLRRVAGQTGPQLVVVLVTVLGAAVAVEQVFAIPGAGTLAVDSALAQDLPTLQACLAGLLGVGLVGAVLAGLSHRALLGPALVHGEAAALQVPDPPRSRAAYVAGALLFLLALGLTRDGSETDLGSRLLPPSPAHPLGTDGVGHDLWGRLAHGSLLTVGLAIAISAAALVVGLVVGLPARSGGVGAVDVWVVLPSTVVGVAVASVVGPGLPGACLAVLLVAWIPLAVHARTLTTEAWSAGHVRAATLSGSRTLRTLRVHVLPAVLTPMLRHALVRVPVNALGLAGLSFIGLGADPDAAELGAVVADGLRYLERAPWLTLAPAAVLVALAVIAGTLPTSRRGV